MGFNTRKHLGQSIGFNSGKLGFVIDFFKSLCSFLFGGTNQYINIDESLPSLATTTKGTWLAVVKPIDATPLSNTAILTFGDTDAPSRMFLFHLTTGKLGFQLYNNTSDKWQINTDNAVFLDNTWITIAIVQDGVNPILYVNGVAVAQTFISSVDKTQWFNDITGLDNGRIGCLEMNGVGNTNFSNNYTNQVAFLDTNATQEQITNWHNNGKPKNPSSIFGANVVYNQLFDSAEWDSASSEWGLFDSVNMATIKKAFSLNVNKSFELDALLPLISTDTKGTINILVSANVVPPGTSEMLFAFGDTNADTYIQVFQSSSGGVIGFALRIGGVVQWDLRTTGAGLTQGEWSLISCITDGVEPIIKINDIEVPQSFTTSTDKTKWIANASGLDNVRIGCRNINSGGDTLFFSGKVCQVSYINTNATDEQITELYNEGNPKNPQSIFGTACKLCFNPDLGVWGGANYTVEDAINSVTATSTNVDEINLKYRAPHVDYSVNMIESDKRCSINPYNTVWEDFGGLHFWDFNEQSDVGTTITRFDQIGSLDMANPSGASEPTINGDYLSYDGVAQYLSNAVSNFRSGDNTGVITVKFKATDGTLNKNNMLFAINDPATDPQYLSVQYRNLLLRTALVTSGAVVYSLEHTTPIVLNSTNVFSVFSNGTTIKAMLNGTIISLSVVSGVNDGKWVNDFVGNTEQISIGALIRSASIFGDSKTNQVMYSSYISEQTIIDIHTKLLQLP